MQKSRIETNMDKEIVINKVCSSAPFKWIKLGVADMRASPTIALFYGVLFTVFTYSYWYFLSNTPMLRDISGPLLMMVIIVFGPISALGLYNVSKRLAAGESLSFSSLPTIVKSAFKTNGSCPSIFLSALLIVLAIAWMVLTPLMYAVFHTSTFVSQDQTIFASIVADLIALKNPIFVVIYLLFSTVVAWIAFMISWFSFPMVMDQDVDPFTAASASLKTAMANKVAMLIWIPIVGVMVLASLLTPYFIGLIVVVPILAHATWHAYKDMIGEVH